MIDSHCHLNLIPSESRKEVIDRAFEAGIIAMQNISTTIEESTDVIAQANQDSRIYASIGTHPCNAVKEPDITTENIVELHNKHKEKVIGIGETGLDYYHNSEPETIKVQTKQFIRHIEAACVIDKPIIVHTRSAEEDTHKILKNLQSSNPKILIHCFTGTEKFMEQMLDLKAHISFSGIVTFKNAKEIQRCASIIPIERMLIETDAPYLAPQPMRGRSNEPSYIKHTAQFLADLREIPLEEFNKQITENFCKLFKVRNPLN